MPYTIQPTALKYKNGNVFMSADCLKGDPGDSASLVTPEQFGAVGDGVTDDTAAVQAAIDHGGLIVCSKIYRITSDINLRNPDYSGDTGLYPRSRIVGRSGIIAQLDSSSIVDYLQVNQATFYHDGGRFVFKYTSNVEFSDCVFMGSKSHNKTDFAFFASESPFRRLHIENCTFANFKCAIYGYKGEEENYWSGECIFRGLYFALCDYCICFENVGIDSVFQDMIAQGTCGYFLRLTDASNALIQGNHDYSSNGCVIYGSANITGNYFDGIKKLHIKGNKGENLNSAKYSPVIVGNNFFIPQSTTGDSWIIAVDETLFGAVVCDNIIVGGDNTKIVLFNLANAEYFYQNVVRNNAGKLDGMFTPDITIQTALYGNDMDTYRVFTDLGTGSGEKVYEKLFWGIRGCTLFLKCNTPKRLYLRGTAIDGIYSEVLSFVKVTLTNNTTDSKTFTKDGAALSIDIENEWGFNNISTLEAEIHINFGVIPVEGFPQGAFDRTIPVNVPTAPDFEND